MTESICTWCKVVWPVEDLVAVYPSRRRMGEPIWAQACPECIEKRSDIREQLRTNALRALGAL